jgi:transaldolase
MKFYIDSGRIADIASLMATGVFHGVTTNPLILRDAGVRPEHTAGFAAELFARGVGELFLQSWGDDVAALTENAQQLAAIDRRVVVKLPATGEGLAAAAGLTAAGVRICITAVYAPFQGLLAAAVGAAYAAPYLGRMTDAGRDGQGEIARMAAALQHTGSRTMILAASVRSPEDVAQLAGNGVSHVTLAPAVARMMFQEPLTLAAVSSFENAARELAGTPSGS